jgi:hypothetical protein
VNEFDGIFDTMIEVVDLSTRRVLASVRLPGYPLNFIGDGYVGTFQTAPDGTSYIQIWRIEYA